MFCLPCDDEASNNMFLFPNEETEALELPETTQLQGRLPAYSVVGHLGQVHLWAQE